MIPRPPRSTRTDTLFPYPTLFRSQSPGLSLWSHFPLQRRWRRHSHGTSSVECRSLRRSRRRRAAGTDAKLERSEKIVYRLVLVDASEHRELPGFAREQMVFIDTQASRSEERRVGKEWVRQCRSLWSPYQ